VNFCEVQQHELLLAGQEIDEECCALALPNEE
jgi:hypothetical protein